MQFVAQPLDKSARHKHAAFKGIFKGGGIRRTRSNGGNQVVATRDSLLARMHEQEAARAIGVLCFPWARSQVTKECRLLVARYPTNGNIGRNTFKEALLGRRNRTGAAFA